MRRISEMWQIESPWRSWRPVLPGVFGFIAPGSAQSAPDSTAVVVYTVQPGDTLWRYAASITPEGGNVGDTVDELMRLNNLDTVSLHAGQRLVVPHEA